MALIPPSQLTPTVPPAKHVSVTDPPDDIGQAFGAPSDLQAHPTAAGAHTVFETYLATQAAPVVSHPAVPGEARPDSLIDGKDAALRLAEAAERALAQKEMLARIPVPIEAIPKLSGDLEQLRKIEQDIDHSRRPDRADRARSI